MLRTVHLHGRLKKQFGPSYRFDVQTAGEAMRALNCAFPGEFVNALKVGSYQLVRGDRHSGMRLDLELLNSLKLGIADLHLIPLAKGASNGKGSAKTIIGVALIGAALFASGGSLAAPLSLGSLTVPGLSWGSVAAIGLGMTLQGVSMLLSKPETTHDKDNSFTINGPSNIAEQGAAVPLVYGEVITGSVVVSFDANVEDYSAYQGLTDDAALNGLKAAGVYGSAA